MPTEHDHAHADHASSRRGMAGLAHYRGLVLMAALSFAAMFVLMYAMVDRFANVYVNANQFYMAGLMTAPMVLIEMAIMRSMYRDRRLNAIAIAVSLVVGLVCWTLIRQQTAIGDRQFLRSMIPHHAAALLMCTQAPVHDAGIQDLCRRILASQRAEIDEMKAKLEATAR